MLSFVRNQAGKAEAQAGAHDDCVIALAIAHHIRTQQSMIVKPEGRTGRAWTSDMWEDYNNASHAQKWILKDKWGRPY